MERGARPPRAQQHPAGWDDRNYPTITRPRTLLCPRRARPGAHPAVAHTHQAYFLSFTRVVFTFTREKIRVF